jgi:hypothetical protein
MRNYQAIIESMKSKNIPIKHSEFDDEAFGSWYIELDSQPLYRIVHDGRDKTIVLEENKNHEWSSIMADKTKSGKHILARLTNVLSAL